MKAILLLVLSFMLVSCTFSGSYSSSAGQNFDFNTTIIIPVEDCKK